MLQKGKKFTPFSEMENNLRVRNFCGNKNRKNSGVRVLYSVQCTTWKYFLMKIQILSTP